MRIGRVRGAAALLLLAVTLVGCGDDDDDEPPSSSDDGTDTTVETDETDDAVADVLAGIEGLGAAERTAKLVELAQEEGGITLYTSMAPEVAEQVIEAFEDTYDIDVSVFRSDTEGVAQRVAEEGAAGYQGADVVEAGGVALAFLDEALFVDVDAPAVDGLIEHADQGHWIAGSMDVFAASWNTSNVAPADAPTSWEDLADERWQGKLAMEADDIEWYVGVRDHWLANGKSEDEANDLFAAMGANARIVDGHTVMAQLLSIGEFDVAASNFVHHLKARIADGEPLAYEPIVAPLVGRASGIAVSSGARHPAAATLFLEWFLGDGQLVVEELGLRPTRADLQGDAGSELVIPDFETMLANYDELTATYEEVIARGEVHEQPGE